MYRSNSYSFSFTIIDCDAIDVPIDVDVTYLYWPYYCGTKFTPPEPASIEIEYVHYKCTERELNVDEATAIDNYLEHNHRLLIKCRENFENSQSIYHKRYYDE